MSNSITVAYRPAMKNKRVESTVTREVNASPGTIFPLACPVEELRWIPEWDYQLIFSKSGVNEANCIFNEDKTGLHFFEKQLITTWVTTVYDPENYRISFLLNLAGKAVISLDVNFTEVGRQVSRCTWHMVFTALDEEANAIPDDTARLKLELALTFLADALKHYCETGEMIN